MAKEQFPYFEKEKEYFLNEISTKTQQENLRYAQKYNEIMEIEEGKDRSNSEKKLTNLKYNTQYTYGKFAYIAYEFALGVDLKQTYEQQIKRFWDIKIDNVTDTDKLKFLYFVNEYIDNVEVHSRKLTKTPSNSPKFDQLCKKINKFGLKYNITKPFDKDPITGEIIYRVDFTKYGSAFNEGVAMFYGYFGVKEKPSAKPKSKTTYKDGMTGAKKFCNAALAHYHQKLIAGEINKDSIVKDFRKLFDDSIFYSNLNIYDKKLDKCTRFWQNKGSKEFIRMEKAYNDFKLAYDKSIRFSNKDTKLKLDNILEKKLNDLYTAAYIYKNKIQKKCKYGSLGFKFEGDKFIIDDSKYAKRFDFADSIMKYTDKIATSKNIKLFAKMAEKESSFTAKLSLKFMDQQRKREKGLQL